MKIKGIFLTDIHLPDSINLKPVFEYLKDYKPNLIVLGGDIIDATGLHSVENRRASDFKLKWYNRDVKLLKQFLSTIYQIVPKASVVYLEGNHEERYRRVMAKFPDTFDGCFNLIRDCKPPKMRLQWIPYGTYQSYFKLGDCIFLHGTIWPDNHAKRYALDHTPFKAIYGHLHHFQAYTTRKSFDTLSPRYAVTPGCLSNTTPEWKKGAPNQWVNGFLSFVSDGKVVIPTVHMIEAGRFYIGNKEYKP